MYKLVFTVWLFHTWSITDCTIISTTTGLIQGKMVTDEMFDIYYYSYEGIPYAEPPLGDLRFRPPVPKKPWSGTLDATAPGSVCPQIMTIPFSAKMNEDCLFLNVFAPVTNVTTLLPVIIAIHPGDLEYNSGNAEELLGPQLILKTNTIIVTLNYRLGALGFLSLGSIDASGNAGVKDVLLATKWVNENIEEFGGDPGSITIMGFGAGAAIAHALLLSERSTGLFQGATLYSGSVVNPKFIQRHPRAVALLLCLELGLKMSDTRNLLRQLKEVDAISIVQAQTRIVERDPQRGFRNYIPFGITIEIETSTAIITREPWELIKEGIKQNVPIVTGFDNNEGLDVFPILKEEPGLINRLNQNSELLIPSDIEYPFGSALRKNLAARIKKFYFNNEPISVATTQRFVNLVTDSSFGFSIDSWVKLHTQRVDSAPVYYYVFAYDAELNWDKVAENITYSGAAPTDELGYLFVTKFTKSIFSKISSRTRGFVNRSVNLLSNFLRFRNPTPYTVGGTLNWPEAGRNRGHQYIFDATEFIPCPPYPKRYKFWYNVYTRYYQYLMTAKTGTEIGR